MPGSPGEKIIFQFDQCFNDKSIADGCNKQGLAIAYRYPKSMHGQKDPEVLEWFASKGNPLLTTDLKIAMDHAVYIPDSHPGIIAISAGKTTCKTITSKLIKDILVSFKLIFPEWCAIDLSNSVMEVTPVGVELFHVEGGALVRDALLEFSSPDWKPSFKAILAQNATALRQRKIN